MGAGVFENVDKIACELKVPKGHRNEYAEAEQWEISPEYQSTTFLVSAQ